MNSRAVITILVCIIILLAGVIIYQQFVYKVFKTKYGIQAELKKITQNISDILDNNTDEKVMVFTDNKIAMDLCGQINRLVLDRQKIQAGYKKQEISLKKMLANISHDIKTPLTVISGYLEIMRINGADALALQKAEAKANQVAGLVNQFFTLAKLEAGDMVMDMENVNISELCRENILDFYEILTRKDFNVDISVPEENIYVYGDKRAIERILTNILSNAIHYGIDGKYIGIFLHSEEGFALIDITDKGKGIEKEFAENVFERLYTMEDPRSRRVEGNGLGLAIAKNLAVQMGGDVLLVSRPGVQTTFTIKLRKI